MDLLSCLLSAAMVPMWFISHCWRFEFHYSSIEEMERISIAIQLNHFNHYLEEAVKWFHRVKLVILRASCYGMNIGQPLNLSCSSISSKPSAICHERMSGSLSLGLERSEWHVPELTKLYTKENPFFCKDSIPLHYGTKERTDIISIVFHTVLILELTLSTKECSTGLKLIELTVDAIPLIILKDLALQKCFFMAFWRQIYTTK